MTAPAAVPAPQNKTKIPIGLIAGFVALIAVLLMPLPADLPVAGHRMLAILAFAVVVDHRSRVVRSQRHHDHDADGLPARHRADHQDPQTLYGTSAAISMALTGFAIRRWRW